MNGNWDLTGHEWAVDLLQRHIANNEARHAYLITGPDGVGRRTLALRFAMALNCANPPAPGGFCGECRNCKLISAGHYVDLVITPSFILDGSLGVDRIREARPLISRTPFQSRYRLSLFPDFQMATDEAQNALLKTLEEAPAHSIMVLTANDPGQLLSTIVSRCEVIRLQPPGVGKVEAMLQGENHSPEKARLYAHIGEGRPGYAKELLRGEDLWENRVQRLNELKIVLKSSRLERFKYAESLAKSKCTHEHVESHIDLSREEQRQLESVKNRCVLRRTYPVWLSFWRDVLIRTSGAAVPIVNLDVEAQIDELASRLDLPAARRLAADMELGLQRLERNVNPRLLTEVLLLDWPRI